MERREQLHECKNSLFWVPNQGSSHPNQHFNSFCLLQFIELVSFSYKATFSTSCWVWIAMAGPRTAALELSEGRIMECHSRTPTRRVMFPIIWIVNSIGLCLLPFMSCPFRKHSLNWQEWIYRAQFHFRVARTICDDQFGSFGVASTSSRHVEEVTTSKQWPTMSLPFTKQMSNIINIKICTL